MTENTLSTNLCSSSELYWHAADLTHRFLGVIRELLQHSHDRGHFQAIWSCKARPAGITTAFTVKLASDSNSKGSRWISRYKYAHNVHSSSFFCCTKKYLHTSYIATRLSQKTKGSSSSNRNACGRRVDRLVVLACERVFTSKFDSDRKYCVTWLQQSPWNGLTCNVKDLPLCSH
jgi:hypothetical protein